MNIRKLVLRFVCAVDFVQHLIAHRDDEQRAHRVENSVADDPPKRMPTRVRYLDKLASRVRSRLQYLLRDAFVVRQVREKDLVRAVHVILCCRFVSPKDNLIDSANIEQFIKPSV